MPAHIRLAGPGDRQRTKEKQMTEEEILQKLKVLDMERKSLRSTLELLRSSKKLNFGCLEFKPDEKAAISSIVEKWLGQEPVEAVLSICNMYRSGVEKMRRDNLARFEQGKIKRRGRPEGTKDHDAKHLVRKLKTVWKEAKGKLPLQQESAFGNFVEKIARILHIKDKKGHIATLRGQVNDVLRHEDLDEIQLTEKRQFIQQACQEAFIQVVYKMCEKFEFEARIKELPGSEVFDVSVQCKTLLKQEDRTK
jgi:hypothetical protein